MHVGALRAGGQHLELNRKVPFEKRIGPGLLGSPLEYASPRQRVRFQQPARTPAPARLLVGYRG